MDELTCRIGQITAALQQLPPEALSRGAERHRTERIAHLPQQRWQMRFKTAPILSDQQTPPLHFGTGGLTVEAGSNRRGVHHPIRLRKGRQTTHADPTVPTPKTPHPNPQHQGCGGADVTMIISQPFQGVRSLAVGAVFRPRDLPVIFLLGILFGGQ